MVAISTKVQTLIDNAAAVGVFLPGGREALEGYIRANGIRTRQRIAVNLRRVLAYPEREGLPAIDWNVFRSRLTGGAFDRFLAAPQNVGVVQTNTDAIQRALLVLQQRGNRVTAEVRRRLDVLSDPSMVGSRRYNNSLRLLSQVRGIAYGSRYVFPRALTSSGIRAWPSTGVVVEARELFEEARPLILAGEGYVVDAQPLQIFAEFLRCLYADPEMNLAVLRLLLHIDGQLIDGEVFGTTRYVALSQRTIEHVMGEFRRPEITPEVMTYGSDADVYELYEPPEGGSYGVVNGVIKQYEKTHQREVAEGALFKFLVKPEFFKVPEYAEFFNKVREVRGDEDLLAEYGIYTAYDQSDAGVRERYEDICFIKALQVLGIPQSVTDSLRKSGYNQAEFMPVTKIEQMCERGKFRVALAHSNGNHINHYGTEGPVCKLGLIDKHYVARKRQVGRVTDWSVIRYLCKHPEYLVPFDFHQLASIPALYNPDLSIKLGDCVRYGAHTRCDVRVSRYEKLQRAMESADKKSMSLKVKTAEKQKRAKAAWEVYDVELEDIEAIEAEVRGELYLQPPAKPKVPRPSPEPMCKEKPAPTTTVVAFDFETNTHPCGKIYATTAAVRFTRCGRDLGASWIGDDCALKMLRYLAANFKSADDRNEAVLMVAHNAKFDYQFILSHVIVLSECTLDNAFISARIKFDGVSMEVRDSLKLISEPLAKFPSMFGLEGIRKEVLPYKLYDDIPYENLTAVDIETACGYLTEDDIKAFMKNISEWRLKSGMSFDALEYRRLYCEQDVVVLLAGYKKFREYVMEHLDPRIDIHNFTTISGVANEYMVLQGCYEGCVDIGGFAQRFIQESVRGGRVMTNNNKMYHTTMPMADYDGVSLYPSAMARMPGFLMGMPKPLQPEQLNDEFLSVVDGYFIQITVTGVGKPRDFPLIGVRSDGKPLKYTNDLVGCTFIVDKTTLEDLVAFQGVEYTILQGFYFDTGRNSHINDVIQRVFNLRCELKAAGNPAQNILKLVMNASYGKNILKAREKERIVVNSKAEFEVWASRNYARFISARVASEYDAEKSTTDKIVVSAWKRTDEHINACHIGAEILSMSKRIMNEVMTTAEDHGVKVYYQDTDSMHLPAGSLPVLEMAFEARYNRTLTGFGLGQFHNDFPSEFPVAKESWFLAPKVYMDILSSEDGLSEAYHIRMKGVSSLAIKHQATQLGVEPSEIYRRLYNGDTVKFDLTCAGDKFTPRYKVDGIVALKAGEFTRSVVFCNEKAE